VDTVLELRSLTKHFPTHRAVNGVSLTLERGEFFCLVGPSGCGKTTTLRLIAGLENPTAGEIYLDGNRIDSLPPFRRDVSTVFQNYALFPHLTVAQNVAFGLEQRRNTKAEIRRKLAAALELVRLSGKEARVPSQISGGERQRTALARSLVLEPKVLLLDEPLSALDPKLRKHMRAELKDLQRQVNTTFLFITHDQEEALSMSDRLAVMNEGTVEQLGTARELYQRPASRFVAEFLGEVNWLNGAAVRPEALRISREHPGAAVRSMPGLVEGSTFLGDRIQLQTRLDGGNLCTAAIEDSSEFLPGEPVHVWWRISDELRLSERA
jgi:spermidine/putrescine transport system ATP-binding protein